MKKPKPAALFPFLARQLVIPLLTLWLISMTLLTWAAARDFYRQLEAQSLHWMQIRVSGAKDELPGAEEYNALARPGYGYMMLHAEPLLPIMLPQRPSSIGSDDWYWGRWELVYGFQAAMALYDAQGERTFASGDYLCFSWASTPSGPDRGYGYIDLNMLEGGPELADRYISTYPMGDNGPFALNELKLTGRWEGNRFIPVQLQTLATSIRLSFPDPAPDQPLVTIYTTNLQGYNYDPGSPFRVDGKVYDNAAQLLEEGELSSRFNLFTSLIRSRIRLADGTSVAIAVKLNPLSYAALRLLPLYLVSLALLGLLLVWMLRRTRAQLTDPLAVINRSYEQDRAELSVYARSSIRELQELAGHYNTAQQTCRQAQNRAQQLQTALDYANHAEASRRKMVSAVAHELKTPLAVIHSYAEGLQAGIAGEKQDHYLRVILDETEQMDAMVLEMLDLSRLEAGKVQLSTDPICLQTLTRSVFDRLELAVQAKNLTVEFQFGPEQTITADEGRILQVITNLATNAIKYTPAGGRIRVQVSHYDGAARFFMENDCPALSQDALDQVWDSFYRADDARSGAGTGLGLAIVKSIVELHRGSCSARSTERGVEFSFRIPL